MDELRFGSSEVIAALALAASVISLLVSWRAGHHNSRITTYRSATDLTLDIDHIFVQHPTLRKYFYGSEEVDGENEETQAQVHAIAELMLDCFECIWDIRASYAAVDRGSWGQYVLDMLSTSPVMCQMFESRTHQDWYPALADLKQAESKGRLKARTIRMVRWARRFWEASTPASPSADGSEREV